MKRVPLAACPPVHERYERQDTGGQAAGGTPLGRFRLSKHPLRSPLASMLIAITVAGAAVAGLIGASLGLIAGAADDLAAVAIAAGLTWIVFVVSLIPVVRRWRGAGLAVVQGYLIGAAVRVVLGLGGSLWLVGVAGRPAVPTLLTFAGTYLAMMFAEVLVMARHLQRRTATRRQPPPPADTMETIP